MKHWLLCGRERDIVLLLLNSLILHAETDRKACEIKPLSTCSHNPELHDTPTHIFCPPVH